MAGALRLSAIILPTIGDAWGCVAGTYCAIPAMELSDEAMEFSERGWRCARNRVFGGLGWMRSIDKSPSIAIQR